QGRALHHTDLVMQELEKEVGAWPQVRSVYSSVGGSNKNQFARESHEENVGQLYVVMRDKADKTVEAQTIARIRERLARSAEITYTFQRPTLFSVKTPVEVEIFAYDLDVQRKTADLMADRMRGISGLSDVRTSTELGNPEIQVRFDREKLARLGLDEAQVANIVRSKIRGDVASRFREDDKQIEIVVRASEQQRNTVGSVGNLLINVAAPGAPPPVPTAGPGEAGGGAGQGAGASRNAGGTAAPPAQPNTRAAAAPTTAVVPIRLGSIANISIDRGPAEVRRVRSQRAAIVSANLTGRDLTSVSNDIRNQIRAISTQIPPEVTVSLGGQNEELNTSYRSLMFALAMAVFLVYLVMASEFESLIHPFVILFSGPFGLVGVVFALAITGTTISVMVLLGVIILVGIVVNNAIVLIDYANQLRSEGYSRRDALRMAGEVRLRPILMTTMTSALGLVPMALGWGEGAEIRSPMAIAVIGGMTFSTALTLIFIPVMYELLDRRGHFVTAEQPRTAEAGGSIATAPAGD
ncbi:MAG TPA: efflux RND transporter permease subunit, partial [Bryobacteraceae bacterium]|nr:efflux RND transporter permease subunit [Bryobacteraceae bacterium]